MKKISKWYKDGDKRIRDIFLWFPRTKYHNNGEKETRWWEQATIEEEFKEWGWDESGWVFINFVNI
jgi:hypothetical protein